jgi:NADH-quinone oxidoreductase subunit I
MSPQRHSTGGALPGLVKGLATTARTMVRPAHTAEYPDAPPTLPPRSRGVIALLEENCTSCMLCARECPDWCIYIDSHKETIPAETPGGRDRQRNVLDRFAIDFSLCMYCGICIEVCPFDALFWSPQFEYAETDIRDLLHEKERLGEWMPTVPAPPALDEHSADPAEVTAANKPARAARGAEGARPRRAEPERQARPAGETRSVPRSTRETQEDHRTEVVPAPATSEPTERLPAAREDETQQLPATSGGDETQQLPATSGGDETQQLPATAGGDETQQLPATAGGDETQQLPATAGGDETQQLPEADRNRTSGRRHEQDDS